MLATKAEAPKVNKWHVAPHWALAAISILGIATGVFMTVRANDLTSVDRRLTVEDAKISAITQQTNRNAMQIAVLVQKETDLLDLLNRYMGGKTP